MTPLEMQQRLSDLIGFQCVLVALRGVSPEASEEMLWQTLVSELLEQYGLRRAWYGNRRNGELCPVVLVDSRSAELGDLPAKIEETSSLVSSADLVLPVVVEGRDEGRLLLYAGGNVAAERAEQIRILTAEAATMLAERRSRLRNERALKQAKREAESANRAKSMMLANMSHEIRTPMSGVLGFAELLARTPLSAEQMDYVETIRSSGEVLLTLINDILDYSKIESGKLQLELLPVDIRSAVEKVVGLLRVQASEKQLCFSSAVDPAVPDAVLGDVVRLRQILMNLLGNAIKFTAQGEVSLVVSSRPCEDGRHLIEFVVRDTGPGIAPADQARVFDSFRQVDASISRKHGGTGLGLAISMALTKQMGGSLWVESEVGKGSIFHVSLPAQAVPVAAGTGSRLSARDAVCLADGPGLRVLVAEDNEVNRRAILGILKILGCNAEATESGEELIHRLASTIYDVVLMDVQMPELDGLEATRRIRRDLPPSQQPYIIALTAAAFPEDRFRCLEAGMNDYLAKPVDLGALAEALRKFRPVPAQPLRSGASV